MVNEDMLGFFKRLVKNEKDYAKRLKKSAERSENLAVKALIESVSMDSLKHSMFYDALAKGLGNVGALTRAETEELIGEIEYHIKTEAEFIKELQERMKDCENNTVKFILKAILRDEIYHHALLTTIKHFIVEKQKEFDENLWQMLEGLLSSK